MSETQRLFQKAQKYLRSAAVLLEMEDYDSCASRSYFAMFYAAQAVLLAELGKRPNQQGIRTAFRERFVETQRLPERAAEALERAHDQCEMADYGSAFGVKQEHAERTLQEAEAFVNSLQRLSGRSEAVG